MKVLYILHSTIMSGAAISFINLIKEISKNNVEIYVVYPDSIIDPVFYEETKDLVKRYYQIPLSVQICHKYPILTLNFFKDRIKRIFGIYNHRLKRDIKALKHCMLEIQPDIVHTNVGVIHSGFFAAKELKIPHVWHLREYQTKDFNWDIYPSYNKFVSYLRQSYVIAITKDILNFFQMDGENNAQRIYNGCFYTKDIAMNLSKEKYFLSCSRISDEKGIYDIIKAFSIFYKSHSNYKLKIAGFGDEAYIDNLKKIVLELGCENAVEFVGYQKDIKPLLDNATALIVASRFEAFGRMTAEALFRGCLVIGRNTGGTKEILDMAGGFLFDTEIQSIVEQMEKVIGLSQDEYESMVKKAQRVAMNEFSIEGSAKEIKKLYRHVIVTDKWEIG